MLYMAFQATFCIITAALISGAIVERMRFSAYLVFISLWSVVVYAPLAHWVWGGGWLATWARGTSPAARSCTSTPRRRRSSPPSWSASASDYGTSSILPHNVPFVLLGAGLLWFGWFGFNAGSALAASPIAGLAFVTTMLAPAATLVVWTFLDMIRSRQADRGRLRHGDRRRPRRDHAGRRVHQPDERAAARRHCRGAELFRADHPRQDVAGRLAGRRGGARRRRHGRRAADRRVRGEEPERRCSTARCTAIRARC